MMRLKLRPPSIIRWLAVAALASSCDDVSESPLVSAPSTVGVTASTASSVRFDLAGHWEGQTDQGRRIAFDVSPAGYLSAGRINLHHDCAKGGLRMTIDGYESQVADHAFSATLIWRIEDQNGLHIGKVTMSGRFESEGFARGGFVDSVTRSPSVLGECRSIHGTWEAGKED